MVGRPEFESGTFWIQVQNDSDVCTGLSLVLMN